MNTFFYESFQNWQVAKDKQTALMVPVIIIRDKCL